MAQARQKPEGFATFEMRSTPRQSRSKNTVAVIKQAALELIAAEGLASCVTYRIAERAGIGVGSLYQYFPNRESILKSLYEDVSIAFAGEMQNLTLRLLDLPTEEAVMLVMRRLVKLHESNQLVLLRLVNEMPELRLEDQPLAFSKLIMSSIRAYVQHRNPALKARELAHRVFFLERIILSSIQRYLNDPPAGMTRKEFTRNLARLVSGYIEGPA